MSGEPSGGKDAFDVLGRLIEALAERYTINRELGSGGMATVYLAEDLKHARKVAVKVLRPELVAILGNERFLQEIQLTANLQHPNILALYDSGQADTFLYYVMPYVEGETLRDKLEREKQLDVKETIEIGKSVASALHYAHQHGVVHRDIKPENILLQSGQALVADFGIALAVSQAGGTRLTETGMSLGTPHYMSPEQAAGDRELDARSDVYSLAAMIYELLVGEPPHVGNSVQAIIGKILWEQPLPVSQTRTLVPTHVDQALLKALAKSPADRFATAEQFAAALTDVSFTLPRGTRADLTSPVGKSSRRYMPWLAVATGAVGLFTGWLVRSPAAPELPVVRLSMDLPLNERLEPTQNGPAFALSPDGRRMVYVGPRPGGRQLWLRELDELRATPIRGTDEVCCPVFSPNGEHIAYLTADVQLRVRSLSGRLETTLAASGLVEHNLYGGSLDWGRDGFLYVSTTSGLARVPQESGPLELVSVLDSIRGDRLHAWAHALPNGNGALVTVIPGDGSDRGAYTIGALDFDSRNVAILVQGVYARYADTGHLVYVREDGALLAAPFDADRLTLTGPSVQMVTDVRRKEFGAAEVALSESGFLVYGTGDVSQRQLVWVDRYGEDILVLPDSPGGFNDVALSGDGTRLAVSIEGEDAPHDIWTMPVGSRSPSRLTFEGSTNWHMSFGPDRRTVTFISDRDGTTRLYRQRPGSAQAERLAPNEERPIFEGFWSPDGAWLIYRTDAQAAGGGDILALPGGSEGPPVELVATPAGEYTPALSPDGRWLAYVSNETGRLEVYVQPFLATDGARWLVSRNGGTEPLWAPGGTELFYRNLMLDMIAVEYTADTIFTPGVQTVLFPAAQYRSNNFHRVYDVTPDGQRFIMVRSETIDHGELIWVQNWFTELRRALRH
jgi:serine/threonine-protein kinase